MAEKSVGPDGLLTKIHITAVASKRRILVLSVLIIISLLAGTYIYQKNKVNCPKLTAQATSLIHSKEYKKAYLKLQSHFEACGGMNNKQTQVTRLEYDFRLAVSAFQSGNTKQGRSYAKHALDIVKNMPVASRSKLPEEPNLVIDMSDVYMYNVYPRTRSF